MPYIAANRREGLSNVLREVSGLGEMAPGEINYLITCILVGQINLNGTTYQKINELVGVLECAKLEMYRRLAVPYEEQKIKENGDVY